MRFQTEALRVPRINTTVWRYEAAREMREGPSEPAIRSRLQTAANCWR
jgi:hypothetical protein